MLLRPYYAVSDDLLHLEKIPTYGLVLLLLKMTSSARLLLFKMLDIRMLLLFLRAVSKNETTDELNEFSKVSSNFRSVWQNLIEVINNFECLKLVNQYSATKDSSELAIDSDEYEFLLEYVFDIENVEVQIAFPLIDVQTTKFNKIFNFLEKHSLGLKISNDRLSVIKDSESLKSKLVVLDLHNYENFEITKTLKFPTLDVIGDEIDNFTITKLISKNSNLKTINFKGRSKDLVPLRNKDHLELHYEISVYYFFDQHSLRNLGSLDQIRELFLSFEVETDITLNWLKNCSSLETLHFALNFETSRVEMIDSIGVFENLKYLVLQRCELKLLSNLHKFIMPELRTITLIDCAFDFSFLEKLNYYELAEIKLINCDITYDKMIRLPRSLRNFTIINEEIEEVKDLVFLTLQSRDSCINPFCRIILNVNDFVVTLNPQDCHDIFMCRKGFGSTDISQLNFVEGSKIILSIFPHFEWFDLSSIYLLAQSKAISKIILELYSLNNHYQHFHEVDCVPKVEKQLYDVYELFEYLQILLNKEELDEKDKMFLVDWPYVTRQPITQANGQASKRGKKNFRNEKLLKDEGKRKRNKRGFQDTSDSKPIEDALVSKNGLSYFCHVCKKSFARIAALNRHSLIHGDMKPFVCRECGSSFKRADHLGVHKRGCSTLKD